MVKFVINCIQIQNKFKYAHQQILFFKLLFNVKLIYSIQVLGPWLWGNRPFVFFSGGAEEGAQWGKCPTTPWYSKMPCSKHEMCYLYFGKTCINFLLHFDVKYIKLYIVIV
jgi:hypothetical protein